MLYRTNSHKSRDKWLPLFIAIAVSLSGCSNSIKLNVHWVPTVEELKQHCGDDFLGEPDGCAKGGVMTTPASDCDVYVLADGAPSFDDLRTMQTLGHEVNHCLQGRIHR